MNGGVTLPMYSFEEIKALAIVENRGKCSSCILSVYSLNIQSSMNLGIYPEIEKNVMTDFIAGCIEEENRVFDLLDKAENETEIEAVLSTVVYPNKIEV